MLLNEFDIAEIEALWLSCIKIWGVHFTSIFSVVSIMAGWIAEMLFMLFFAYTAVQRTKHGWLMGFPTINLWGTHFTSILSVMADNFHTILCLYCCVMNTTKLSTKHTGLSLFQ